MRHIDANRSGLSGVNSPLWKRYVCIYTHIYIWIRINRYSEWINCYSCVKRIEIILDPKAEHSSPLAWLLRLAMPAALGRPVWSQAPAWARHPGPNPRPRRRPMARKWRLLMILICRFFSLNLGWWAMMGDEFWVFLRQGWLRLGADVTALFCGRLPRVFGFIRGFFIGQNRGGWVWRMGRPWQVPNWAAVEFQEWDPRHFKTTD